MREIRIRHTGMLAPGLSSALAALGLAIFLFCFHSNIWADEAPGKNRRELLLEAEKASAEEFAKDHYFFLTPRGRVDPSEGGIPTFAVELRHWSLYRGARQMSEYQILKLLGRKKEVRQVIRRKILGGGLVLVGTAVASATAPSESLPLAAQGAGVLGGFATGYVGLLVFGRNVSAIGELFWDLQKLNDTIRENLRAQYRVLYDVPALAPSITPEPE